MQYLYKLFSLTFKYVDVIVDQKRNVWGTTSQLFM